MLCRCSVECDVSGRVLLCPLEVDVPLVFKVLLVGRSPTELKRSGNGAVRHTNDRLGRLGLRANPLLRVYNRAIVSLLEGFRGTNFYEHVPVDLRPIALESLVEVN
jgi:hypothetical protein